MHKFLILTLVFIFFVSCKNNKKDQSLNQSTEVNFNIEEWPKKLNVNAKAADILNKWLEYQELESTFASIYNIDNAEDLSLIIEDLIEKQKAMAESTYPLEFDTPHIKSRQLMLKTYILKTKSSLEYRIDFEPPVIEMIDAFNALRNQFNVILNSKIDIDLIQGDTN
ncbi:hypothetical protein [Aurantibacter sp.]|uniref:hypothetical protein n=1 Tax=Aurantibacter sp. TaxID=2807103 RepID=UPI003263C095